MTQTDLIARRDRLLGPAYRLFYDEPAHFVRGEGVWLYDAAGDAFLDVYNNVASLGHCHPRVVAAITKQAATLNTHTRYLHETILDCAEALLATLPDHIDRVMFTCSGSEANDLAVRIAEAYTGRTGVIVTELAYHGVTHAVSQMSPSLGDGVVRGPHIFTVPSPLKFAPKDRAAGFAQAMDDVIARMTKAGFPPALFICDTLFSSDGVISDPAGFVKPAVERVQAAGGLFVADEVQAGFGRTGEAMWGFQRHGLNPDLVSMGKPMGNGHPVAGVAMRAELIEQFGKKSRYFNTFGGNPVSSAAALAVLNVIADEGLITNAREVGAYLKDGLHTLSDHSDHVGEVRGTGLFFGVDIITDGQPDGGRARRIVNYLRQHKVLISATGPHGNVLKIRPPLVFRPEHVDRLLAVLSAAVSNS